MLLVQLLVQLARQQKRLDGLGFCLVICDYWETWLKLVMLENLQACFFIISGIAGNTTDALNAASLADATASLYQETIKTCFSTQDLKSEEIGLPSCVEHKLTQSYYLNNRGKLTVARVLSCFAYNQPDIQYCPMLYPIASVLRHYLSGTD